MIPARRYPPSRSAIKPFAIRLFFLSVLCAVAPAVGSTESAFADPIDLLVDARDDGRSADRHQIAGFHAPDSTLAADGVPIHFSRFGRGATALVFVHGWTLDETFWREQVGYFAPDYQVVTLDLAGHGRSGTGRGQWTMASFGDDVVAVADDVDAERIVLIGHSMGGPVVIEAARKLGDRLAGLVFIDSFHDPDQRMPQEERDGILTAYRSDFETSVEAMVRQYLFAPETDSALVDVISRHMAAFDPAIGVAAIEAYFGADYRTVFPRLTVPKVAINSDLYPTNAESLSQYGIDVRILRGVGHFPMVEDPAAFNETLASVLSTLH